MIRDGETPMLSKLSVMIPAAKIDGNAGREVLHGAETKIFVR